MSRTGHLRRNARASSALAWMALALAGALAGCTSSDDGPGGDATGTCAAGQVLCGDRCVIPTSDLLNCGACGVACQTGQSCAGGACQCQAGLTACSGACANLAADGTNCGTCGLACPAPQVCSNGACSASCAPGLTQCGSSCVDLKTNVASCGACNLACGAGQSCVAGACSCAAGQTACDGTCTDTSTAPSHCGGCGISCAAGQSCSAGVCMGGGTGGVGTGGASGSGGASTGGGAQTGGETAAGGAMTGGATTGGAGVTGGTGGGTAGSCARPVGACASPQVTVTEVDLGVAITSYGREGDTLPLPLAIASMPSGGSRLAALGTEGQVHIAELDCSDNLVGAFSIPGIDLQDLYADDQGGVVLLTRDATNGGTDNCGSGQLCGGESSPCRTMWLVRFNSAGAIEWETQVTNLSSSLAGYQDGARFIWWYQHHGRIAFDGSSNYAAYFCNGITVNNNACVDIHQGDRMQVVSTSGSLVSNHPDSFALGCSHSWQTRVVWDPRVNRFVMVCATDNDCRIAQPRPYRTVAQGTCDGTLFGGDLVLSTNPGYWVAWSQGGQIRLDHFSGDNPSDATIPNAGASQHPHLVSYGPSNMLLSWETGAALTAQIRNAGDGAAVGSEFTIPVLDHSFQAFKAYDDGSVAYPAAGSSSTQVKIARVMPCN